MTNTNVIDKTVLYIIDVPPVNRNKNPCNEHVDVVPAARYAKPLGNIHVPRICVSDETISTILMKKTILLNTFARLDGY
jgi:hypothetical protein